MKNKQDMKAQETDALTQEQMDKIPEYVERYDKMSLACGETNRPAAEKAIKDLYNFLSKTESRYKPNPAVTWVGGVLEGAKAAAQLVKGDPDVSPEEISAQADTASFGTFEAYWLATYDFIATEMEHKKDELVEIVKDVVTHCGTFWTFEDEVIMSPRPLVIRVKNNKIHAEDGPAIEYPNGEKIFAFEGDFKTSLMEIAMQARARRADNLSKANSEGEDNF